MRRTLASLVACLAFFVAVATATAASLFPIPKFQAITAAGVPLVGGKVYTYVTGTTTPLATYTDATGGTPNANPVILDSRGEANIWLDGSKQYRFVLKTSADVTLWTVDAVGSNTDGMRYLNSLTNATGRTVSSRLQDIDSVADFGTVANGTTSDQTALANAFAAADWHGRHLLFPSSGASAGTPFYKITAQLDVPRKNGQVFQGMGRRASRLYQDTSGQYVIRANHDWATGSTNGMQIRDIWLSGNTGSAGLQMIGANRSDVLGTRIDVPGQGIYNKDTLVVRLIGNEFDGNSYGFLNDGTGTNTGPNNYTWLGNYLNGATEKCISTYSAYGWLFGGNAMESCAKGGLEVTTSGGGIASLAGYAEENKNGVASTFDVFWGSGSYVRGLLHAGWYHNGRVLGQTYDYCPIRIGFADAHSYVNNYLATGNRLFCFANGAQVLNSFFGPQGYEFSSATPVDRSDPSTIYTNVPSNLLSLKTRINDPAIVPTDGQNLLSGTFPYAWSSSLGAGSTFTVSSDSLNGQPTAALVRTTNTSQINRTVTVSATSNSRVRNRFTSFCVDMYVTDASTKNITMSLGDGTNTATTNISLASADGQTRQCASLKVASAATTLSMTIEHLSSNATVLLASESLFVGMDYDAAPQFAGIPTAYRHNLTGSATYDPPSVSTGATIVAATTVTVIGATVGDTCQASHSDSSTSNADKVEFRCKVTAANTATVYVSNWHSGAVDLASGTLRARVTPQ